MRNIIKGNEGLNIMLNEIVDNEMNKTLDEMIAVVKDWENHTNVISCDRVIELLEANKTK